MTPSEAKKRNAERYPGVKLHDCPFCNSSHLYIYENAPSSDAEATPHVVCLECGAGHSTVEKWNTRCGHDCKGWVATTFMEKPVLVHPDISVDMAFAILSATLEQCAERRKNPSGEREIVDRYSPTRPGTIAHVVGH